MRYYKQKDNEWVEPRMKNYYLKCCDCGLVHRMDFRIVKGKVQFKVKRLRRRVSLSTPTSPTHSHL